MNKFVQLSQPGSNYNVNDENELTEDVKKIHDDIIENSLFKQSSTNKTSEAMKDSIANNIKIIEHSCGSDVKNKKQVHQNTPNPFNNNANNYKSISTNNFFIDSVNCGRQKDNYNCKNKTDDMSPQPCREYDNDSNSVSDRKN